MAPDLERYADLKYLQKSENESIWATPKTAQGDLSHFVGQIFRYKITAGFCPLCFCHPLLTFSFPLPDLCPHPTPTWTKLHF